MNFKSALSVIAAAVALLAQSAYAQAPAASAPAAKARAEVKAETAAANKKGELAPAGDAPAKK